MLYEFLTGNVSDRISEHDGMRRGIESIATRIVLFCPHNERRNISMASG